MVTELGIKKAIGISNVGQNMLEKHSQKEKGKTILKEEADASRGNESKQTQSMWIKQ